MPITAEQNVDIQREYDQLRKTGLDKSQATANIKSTLQGAQVHENKTVYDSLKQDYNTAGQ